MIGGRNFPIGDLTTLIRTGAALRGFSPVVSIAAISCSMILRLNAAPNCRPVL